MKGDIDVSAVVGEIGVNRSVSDAEVVAVTDKET